ncbi:conserved protein of unknown function [Methylocella tundrae]|uniref:Ancillary SecYEG translocon subunit/Cell division coordinator CpoB TPR domain-containing protein n=1 Tax=Methylocella tundrae TaxID=227605 RepID=A0A4U8YV95_METTU|nr:tetratricopeptide repeat protein [Methylocella tundrae]VFU07165.1 conserved protein of unknown function [Methylocella tundrae]
MTDFFREVDEDYRRDRLLQIWTKYQSLFIAAAVVIVAATAGWRIYQHFSTKAAEAAGAQYEAALQLSVDGKSAEAQAAFEQLARTGPKGYATLARLRAADEIAGRDPAAAASAFDALVADANYPQAFKDMAQTRAAILRVDSDDPKAFEQKYGALAGANFTYRDTIRELLALAAFRREDLDGAGRWLDMIIADPRAPSALRQRAEAFLGLVQAGKAPPPLAPAETAPPLTAPPAAPAATAAPPAAEAPEKTPAAPPAADAPASEAAPEKAPADSPAPAENAPAEQAPAK